MFKKNIIAAFTLGLAIVTTSPAFPAMASTEVVQDSSELTNEEVVDANNNLGGDENNKTQSNNDRIIDPNNPHDRHDIPSDGDDLPEMNPEDPDHLNPKYYDSPWHQQSGESLPIGSANRYSAKWHFKNKVNTIIVMKDKFDITNRFYHVVSANNFNPQAAKERFVSSDKRVATVNKKGMLKAKNRGVIEVQYQQKVKGGSWTSVGEPVTFYIQKPELEKVITISRSEFKPVNLYNYIGKTTYRPLEWRYGKGKNIGIDNYGNISVSGSKGHATFYAIYGDEDHHTNKEYKITIKLTK